MIAYSKPEGGFCTTAHEYPSRSCASLFPFRRVENLRWVSERGEVRKKDQVHIADRTIPLLLDEQFCQPAIGVRRVHHFLPINKRYQIGILLDLSALAKIGKPGFPSASLWSPAQLGDR